MEPKVVKWIIITNIFNTYNLGFFGSKQPTFVNKLLFESKKAKVSKKKSQPWICEEHEE